MREYIRREDSLSHVDSKGSQNSSWIGLTNKLTGRNWKVALQYEQTMQDVASQDSWMVAE